MIAGPPKITLAPKSQRVVEGSIASFFCKASGNPAPSFHWERRGKRINLRRSRYEIVEVPHMSVLRIEPVKNKRENDITFTCVADNGLGEARAEASLYVYKQDDEVDGKNDRLVRCSCPSVHSSSMLPPIR